MTFPISQRRKQAQRGLATDTQLKTVNIGSDRRSWSQSPGITISLPDIIQQEQLLLYN